jgi:uncharacterized protein (DUF736 family)
VSDYDNNFTGALFRDENRKSDKHPEFTGSAEVDGTEYWLSAWVNESKQGRKYFKIKFKAKDEAAKLKADEETFSDEIPF